MRFTTVGRLVTVLALAVATGGVSGALPALAATAEVALNNGTPQYRALVGQANSISISKVGSSISPMTLRFDDVVSITSTLPQCVYPTAGDYSKMDCTFATVEAVLVDVYDLNDVVYFSAPVMGVMHGGDGDDTFYSGPASDLIHGENGSDTVSYRGRTGAVTAYVATLNPSDDAWDGEGGGAGELDDYLYIENLTGGAGNDKLYGNIGNNRLDGGYRLMLCPIGQSCVNPSGDDILDGGGGQDQLFGDNGNDLLVGASGYDVLTGGSGNDTLDGGTEGDFLFGESGDDVLNGGAGSDELDGGTGTNTLNGGDGYDYCEDSSHPIYIC